MQMLRSILAALVFIAITPAVFAVAAAGGDAEKLLPFSSDEKQARYYALIDELRCPKCQNQNLADSNAPIAADLRQQLFEMLEEGKTDDEILDYMTARYGSFVLYEPPLNLHTMFLWSLPALILVGGASGIALYLRRNQGRAAKAENDANAGQQQSQADSADIDTQIARLRERLQNPGEERERDA